MSLWFRTLRREYHRVFETRPSDFTVTGGLLVFFLLFVYVTCVFVIFVRIDYVIGSEVPERIRDAMAIVASGLVAVILYGSVRFAEKRGLKVFRRPRTKRRSRHAVHRESVATDVAGTTQAGSLSLDGSEDHRVKAPEPAARAASRNKAGRTPTRPTPLGWIVFVSTVIVFFVLTFFASEWLVFRRSFHWITAPLLLLLVTCTSAAFLVLLVRATDGTRFRLLHTHKALSPSVTNFHYLFLAAAFSLFIWLFFYLYRS